MNVFEGNTAMSEATEKTTEHGATNRKVIFVVDDEPMLLELATIILQPQGYQVTTFRDPELALEAFQAASPRPDLVITDYAMHSMNGMQLVEKFRAVAPHLKILLVSGTVGEEVFREAAAKPDKFLAKPYQPHQLIEGVRSLIGVA